MYRLQILSVVLEQQPQPTPSSQLSTRTVLVMYGGMIAVSLIWGAIRGDTNVLVHPSGARAQGFSTLASAGLGIALGLCVVLLSALSQRYFRWSQWLSAEFRRILGPLSDQQITIMAVASGVGEEMFFRGAMQPTLGLVIASLIFGLMHVGPDRRFLIWTVFAVALGFVFGIIFEYTGDLLAVIIAHFTINFFNLRMLYWKRDDGSNLSDLD